MYQMRETDGSVIFATDSANVYAIAKTYSEHYHIVVQVWMDGSLLMTFTEGCES
jgi:hypothetical protein